MDGGGWLVHRWSGVVCMPALMLRACHVWAGDLWHQFDIGLAQRRRKLNGSAVRSESPLGSWSERLGSTMEWVIEHIEEFSYFAVAFVLFIAGLGALIPEDIPLIYGGVMAGAGKMNVYIHFGVSIVFIRWGIYVCTPLGVAQPDIRQAQSVAKGSVTGAQKKG